MVHPNNIIYANPLPLLLSKPARNLATLGLRTNAVTNPECVSVYEPHSRTVWVINRRDTRILWERGFFGKGNLSRSEPSWLTRHIKQLSGEEVLTAEEVTARRREQRKQFKTDRAKAIAKAAAEAEAAFAANRESPTLEVPFVVTPHNVPRPTLNFVPGTQKTSGGEEAVASPASSAPAPIDPIVSVEKDDQEMTLDGEVVPDMEHLQLTLQEAFFLVWGLQCLKVLDRSTSQYMSISQLWDACISSPSSPVPSIPPTIQDCSTRPDNPFLVHYAVYHHFRSLGWVVRGGIKFCVDYLLYKRGPVFQHAEFAILVCTEYEDPQDAESSPFSLPTQPFTWAWLSTVNRVNSQVKKTLVLAYVTIPSSRRISPETLMSPKCLKEYSVREVVIRRFVPARMRD